MKHSGIAIPGYRLDKHGKLIKQQTYASVSDKLKRQSSKRVRVKRKSS